MATYKCEKCGIQKNDTLSSQLNTSTTCNVSENDSELSFHKWKMISEEDLVCG
ncbi:hypothetical protein DFR65_102330 [Oceanihabitans sediminis]|uniref:hypothetical protein n=1 Tax=Oceanihabitans sediminis TaxID=1812012 RepID=UPI000E0825A5|nr:hypothetical protein [Oceanihabitans sediminis]RBP32994.1 hypothetical protein DFR65_102330 [Oceanihabitans sediminis]